MFDAIPIHVWLIESGLENRAMEPLFEELCRKLADTPLAIERGHLSVTLLHPTLRGRSLTWHRHDGSIEEVVFQHDMRTTQGWEASPFKYLLEEKLDKMRRRLAGNEAQVDFPVLAEFRDQGMTDWAAFVHRFSPEAGLHWSQMTGMVASWA